MSMKIIEVQEGSVRIGRVGTKLHPAKKEILRDEVKNRSSYYITILCHCPNTQNGFGANNTTFYQGLTSTCGRKN